MSITYCPTCKHVKTGRICRKCWPYKRPACHTVIVLDEEKLMNDSVKNDSVKNDSVSKAKVYKLEQAKQYKLCKFVEQRHIQYAQQKCKKDEIAKEATKELGFEVRGPNVAAAYRMIGIELPRTKRTKKMDKIKILANAVKHLYSQCGVVFPVDFKETFGEL